MPDHLRQQIREAVVTAVTGLTTTAGRVHDSRVYKLETLPALAVYALSEPVEYDTQQRPRGQTRELELVVEGFAKATASLEDTLDTIAKEVEAALTADVTRGGLAKDTLLTLTETPPIEGGANKPHGVVRLTWLIEYRTRENDATVAA